MNQILLNGITLEQLVEALKPLLQYPTTNQLQQPENKLITREETCNLLSINKTSLWKHTKNGKLKSYGLGNRVYYKLEEILEAVKPINH